MVIRKSRKDKRKSEGIYMNNKFRKRCFYIVVSLLFILANSGIGVSAVNTGFTTEPMQDDEVDTFIENVNLSVLTEEPEKMPIDCFDVNDSGMIAIGSDTNQKTVCVYTENGTFQYGYSFDCSGSIGVEWDDTNLNIYFVRSDVIASVAPNGEILDVCQVQNSIENNSYRNHFIHATERTIDDTRYVMRNKMGVLNWLAVSYSQIVVINSTGAENIIYDASQTHLVNMMVSITVIFTFVCIVIVGVIREFIKLKKKTEDEPLS